MLIIRFLKKLAAVLAAVALICGAYIFYQGYTMYSEGLRRMSPQAMEQRIHSRADFTPLSQMPDTYLEGVISVEDKRFYRHPGLDLIAIGRALVNDIRAGSFVEGGSTITQQLAKNMYFNQEKRLSRKAAEVFMALKLESAFTKNEILELYVNSIYFGNGYYSAGAASRGYFGKPVSQLGENECIMLAGIPNAPSLYNPVDNPILAQERQEQVRRQMLRAGFLSSGEDDAPGAVQLTFSDLSEKGWNQRLPWPLETPDTQTAPLTAKEVLSRYLQFCISFT